MIANEFLDKLRAQTSGCAELASVNELIVEKIEGGMTSEHTYRLVLPNHIYFLKETRPNESKALMMLHHHNIRIAPLIYYPELLQNNILISEYIEGETLQNRKLEPQLVAGFAKMQNTFNDPRNVKENIKPDIPKIKAAPDGFFAPGMKNYYSKGMKNLAVLKDSLPLSIIDRFTKLGEKLNRKLDLWIELHSCMPWAWQHHDFRDDHVIGNPQKLVDWGSSYGRGPFLFDLAPYLINEPDLLDIFRENSDICGITSVQLKAIEYQLFV